MSDTGDALVETREALFLLEERLKLARERGEPLTRDAVAGIAFDLMAQIGRLADAAPFLPLVPDNQQDTLIMTGLVELHEEYSCGRDRRVIVARFAARWFLLEGFTQAPLSTYAVHGPFDGHEDGKAMALAMHERASERGRAAVRVVGE